MEEKDNTIKLTNEELTALKAIPSGGLGAYKGMLFNNIMLPMFEILKAMKPKEQRDFLIQESMALSVRVDELRNIKTEKEVVQEQENKKAKQEMNEMI